MHNPPIGNKSRIFIILTLVATLSFLAVPGITHAQPLVSHAQGTYVQTNLITSGAPQAPTTDSHLFNPWGLVSSTTGPWWVSDNLTGFSTLYSGQGQIVSLVVTIPSATTGVMGTPTGIVFSTSTSFVVSQNGASGSSVFLFSTADGTISGWNPGVNKTNAILAVQRPGAVYRGLALASNGTGPFLYAANFVGRTVDMFDGNFKLVRSFTDPMATTCSGGGGGNGGGDGGGNGGGGDGGGNGGGGGDGGNGGGGGHGGGHSISGGGKAVASVSPQDSGNCFGPFGIQVIGNQVFVTYVAQNLNRQDHFGVAGNGQGFVDVFDTNGNFLRRLTSSSQLNAPWGIALAPANFGQFSNDLLIGNFGDGRINAFNPSTGALLGQLPMQIDGLWALQFGNGATAGATNQLFFTAGPEHGQQGLFGSIQST